jgi:hypothetical protein
MPTITHTPRQQPAATALDQLLADAESAARSLEDNSHEDGIPVDALAVKNWRRRLHSISYLLTNASTPPLPPACHLPTFPSFTGKELL